MLSWIKSFAGFGKQRPKTELVTLPEMLILEVGTELLQRHNAIRAAIANTPLLSLYAQLETAAQEHANWMALNRELSHYEGHKRKTSIGARIQAHNFMATAVGENIAQGQYTAAEVFGCWMNSSGHKANILNPKYTAAGFGFAKNAADGLMYWCSIFASPGNALQLPNEYESGPLYAARGDHGR